MSVTFSDGQDWIEKEPRSVLINSVEGKKKYLVLDDHLSQRITAIEGAMGFATNSTIIPALVGKGHLVILGKFNHGSIRFGVHSSMASVRMFKHNNLKLFENLLREAISHLLVVLPFSNPVRWSPQRRSSQDFPTYLGHTPTYYLFLVWRSTYHPLFSSTTFVTYFHLFLYFFCHLS